MLERDLRKAGNPQGTIAEREHCVALSEQEIQREFGLAHHCSRILLPANRRLPVSAVAPKFAKRTRELPCFQVDDFCHCCVAIGIVLGSVGSMEDWRRVEMEMPSALRIGCRDHERRTDCRYTLRGAAIDERQTVASCERSSRLVSAGPAGRAAYLYQSCGGTG